MLPVEEHGALWRYSPAQSVWDLIKPVDSSAPFPAGRSYHDMTSDGDKYIYIHAGCPEEGRLSDLWSFDISSRAWTQLPSAPLPGRGGSSIAFAAGKLYRMNGFDGSTEQGGAIDVFDPVAATWSTISFQPDGVHGPEPRSVCALVPIYIHGSCYLCTLFGERDPSSLGHAGAGKMLADVWLFEIKTEKWTRTEPKGAAPAPRGWFDADFVQDDAGMHGIIVHGGLAEDNSRLGDVWRLRFA